MPSEFGAHDGPSEWMHLWEFRRSRTRGMAPEDRHTTDGTAMGCKRHHTAIDHGVLVVTRLTEHGADGRLRFAQDINGTRVQVEE